MKWIAYHLPKRVCYWVLIRVGAGSGTILSNEIVPEVPFTVVLERYSHMISERHR